jgi:hypothetical protein
MMCLVTVRQLKPGSYEDFRRAWAPDVWPPQLQRVEVLRNDENPDEVMTIGYVDVSADELETMRDEPEVLQGEMRRLERIAQFEDQVLVNGIFELVEEVAPPA